MSISLIWSSAFCGNSFAKTGKLPQCALCCEMTSLLQVPWEWKSLQAVARHCFELRFFVQVKNLYNWSSCYSFGKRPSGRRLSALNTLNRVQREGLMGAAWRHRTSLANRLICHSLNPPAHPTNQALPAVQRHGVWSAHAPMRIGRRGHTPEWRWLLNPTRLGWAKLDDPGRQEQAERGAVRRFSHRWPEETSTKNCMWDPKCKRFLMSRCQRQSLQWKNAQQNAQINLIFLFFLYTSLTFL